MIFRVLMRFLVLMLVLVVTVPVSAGGRGPIDHAAIDRQRRMDSLYRQQEYTHEREVDRAMENSRHYAPPKGNRKVILNPYFFNPAYVSPAERAQIRAFKSNGQRAVTTKVYDEPDNPFFYPGRGVQVLPRLLPNTRKVTPPPANPFEYRPRRRTIKRQTPTSLRTA